MSEASYVGFSKKLSGAVSSGDLKRDERPLPSGPFVRVRYACNRCGACWLLSAPDQAFRGEWEEIKC